VVGLSKDKVTLVQDLKNKVLDFVFRRNWEHNPKNLAEAICIEAAELLEIFQWVSNDKALEFIEDNEKIGRMREELADVLIYLISFANKMGIDITEAVIDKMRINERKYPIK
jgi:NTP pyrophosphatase (non-canonical NTP hydrolase)